MRNAPVFGSITRLALVAVAAVGLTACDVVVNTMDGGKARAVDQWARTYTMSESALIEVANTNGRIFVEGTDGTTVDVKAEITARAGTDEAARDLLTQIEIREEQGNGRVRLETRYPKGLGRSSVEVKYTLRVPRGAKVDVETVNGAIELVQLTGQVRAETTNGGVRGRDLGGAVTATSTNGGLDIAMNGLGADGVDLETTNGGIELRLPEQTKGTVSVRCVNGGISVTDLPIEKTETSRRRLEGTLNGGGPAIRIETVNGGIRIRRS
ncbi:MAG: DUF4097 family beta strand repeat-containing protein [Vicinamibacterales bacterium]|nr:DUF4097 family beta strand repeat-containing protein [Vicinamibacterales bacterium]